MITDEQLQTIIEDLQGSCGTLDSAVQSATDDKYGEDDLTIEQLTQIDLEIFNCPTCGWWCEISEQHESETGEDICEDCKEEEE